MSKLVFFLAIIACATCQSPAPPSGLTIESLTKVMRPSDPSGKNHSTKVIIGPHVSFKNVVRWQLVLAQTSSSKFVTYNLNVDGKDPTTQEEFVFEGNLEDSDIVRFSAKNSSNGTIAQTVLTMKIQDLGINLAWVGADESSAMASLRVKPSQMLTEIMIDRRVCKLEDSPCYYILPKPKPILGKRCVDVVSLSNEVVQVCDERVTTFKEISPSPMLSLLEDGKMLVEMMHDLSYKKIEVMVFDPQDRRHIYSMNGSNCLIEINTLSSTGEKVRCHHQFTQPEGQTKMKVLVVRLDDNGVVHESILMDFDAEPSEKDMTGVIVGSVIGSLIGVALIILLVLLILKKKDKKSSKSGSSAHYSAAKTESTDP